MFRFCIKILVKNAIDYFFFQFPLRDRYGVDITPLSFVPGGRIDKYLGNLNFIFIRETTSLRENGGISGFVHSFITEVSRIVMKCYKMYKSSKESKWRNNSLSSPFNNYL